MPADDLVLNVRQIAGYTPTAKAPPSAAILMQIGGLGGAYASISPADFVGTALSQGGDMAIGGGLSALSIQGGTAQFSNGAFGVLEAQAACVVNLSATFGSIGGVRIATAADLAALAAATVTTFNGRAGAVNLWLQDIISAGGAPNFSPVFGGCPRAVTPPPTSNSSRLATTAFVASALAGLTLDFAPLDSPNFSGVPTAPTAAQGSADGQLATTAFVTNAVADSTTGVSSFNTRTGVVALVGGDITAAGGALLASPVFTGTPSAPTQPTTDNSTRLATTAFVAAFAAPLASPAFTGVPTGPTAPPSSSTTQLATTAFVTQAITAGLAGTVTTFNGRAGAVNLIGNDVSAAGGALLVSPAFTGTPTAPTAAPNSITTQIATCAYVEAAVATGGGVLTFNGRAGAVVLTAADVSAVGGALLASPAFTGAPIAPTAGPGTNTTQLATCAFVMAAVAAATAGVSSFNTRTGAVSLIATDVTAVLPASTVLPAMNGVASAGTLAAWSRGDHVHPVDTTRAAQSSLANYALLSGATFTGNVAASQLTAGTNTQASAQIVCNAAAGSGRQYVIASGGNTRWTWGADGAAESGGNAGSNYFLAAYPDNGVTAIGIALSIVRSNMAATFGAALSANGFGCQAGVGGARSGSLFSIDWISPYYNFYVGSVSTGQVQPTSDYRVKTNVAALGGMWDRVRALRPVSFEHCDWTPPASKDDPAPSQLFKADGVERWGFIAHELQETLTPSAASGVKDAPNELQSPNPWTVIATITRALQEAMARIETLEARMT
jgi:hypothetical protein